MSTLLAARMQMAFTLGMHIIVACLGVGMPILMCLAEAMFLRTGDAGWRELARRWSKAFAVLFAVGAVSGTVLAFEIPLLWPEFVRRFGAVVGLPFSLEAFAFFLEAIFVGIYIYGWDRLSPRAHLASGVPIAVAGALSAWFVVTANAWMNTPQGFVLAQGKVIRADPIAAMLNPATGAETTHMILAAYVVTGFVVAAYYAACRLRGDTTVYVRRAMSLAAAMGMIAIPLQIISGDWSARMVAATQPVKLAAMEGLFQSTTHAPLSIGGIPDEEDHETDWAIRVPGALSLLAYHDASARIAGLDDFPTDDWPPVAAVHLSFQAMVGAGMLLLAISLWGAASLALRRRWPETRIFWRSLVAAGPLAVLAMEAGWMVTELGRQPWIVQGIMRTREAATEGPGLTGILIATVAIYIVLVAGAIAVLRILARLPLAQERRDG